VHAVLELTYERHVAMSGDAVLVLVTAELTPEGFGDPMLVEQEDVALVLADGAWRVARYLSHTSGVALVFHAEDMSPGRVLTALRDQIVVDNPPVDDANGTVIPVGVHAE